MGLFNRERIAGKTLEQLAGMRVAGLLVGQTLALLADTVRPGHDHSELDTLAETHIRDHGGVLNSSSCPATGTPLHERQRRDRARHTRRSRPAGG